MICLAESTTVSAIVTKHLMALCQIDKITANIDENVMNEMLKLSVMKHIL